MQRRKVDSGLERQFLIAMITSKPFLSSVAETIDVELFQTEYSRLVSAWCVNYWKRYKEAPGKNIQTIYESWANEETRDESVVRLIEALLGELSDESDHDGTINVPHLVDELGVYLCGRQLSRLNDNLSAYVLRGDQAAALREVQEFRAIELGQGAGFDPLTDRTIWARAFDQPADPLIKFPGDAGRFLNPALTRDALIGIQGPEKRGKTFWCVEFAYRALRNQCTVAFFEVGDLSEGQILLRLGVRLAGLPMHSNQVGEIRVPTSISVDRSDEEPKVTTEWQTMNCDRVVTRRAAIQAARKFRRSCGIGDERHRLMISVHPNTSINVMAIEGILQRWRYERDFVPDVVIIDYADILAPELDRKDFRHQTNDTWKALRRLSQEWHCLVIAPTQASTASYDAEVQTMRHFSEDKRKLAHVTGMMGLNQTDDEKRRGLMRLNWVVLREAEFMTKRCLYVGQCLPLARAFCCGSF